MPTAIAILLAALPSLFWLWLIVRHDDHEREPWLMIALALATGALVTNGVLWTRPLLEEWLAPMSLAMDAFVVTALAEEAWKLLAFLPFLCSRELDEPLDGAVYGASVGLGFATVENVFYMEQTGDAVCLLQRAATSTLLHAAATGCLGVSCAEGKLRRFGLGTGVWLVAGLTIAIGGHGLYDLFLSGENAQVYVSLLLVLPAALFLLAAKVHWARSRSHHFHPEP
jgi:protease PrsW